MATRLWFQQQPTTNRTGTARAHPQASAAPSDVGGLVDLPAVARAVTRPGLAVLRLARGFVLAAAAHAGERTLRVLGGARTTRRTG
jgi:hypothetical protein